MASSSWQHVEVHNIGALENFSKFGFSCDSHKHEKFSLIKNECQIRLKATKNVKIAAKLIGYRDESKQLSKYVFTQRKDDTIFFMINFPETDLYKLEIFALPASSENKTLVNVFNYLIKVEHATKTAHVFPKQYADWQGDCYLYEPLVLDSTCNLKKVHFKVNIPNAKKAAIVVEHQGKDWHHLELKGKDFEGSVALDHYGSKDVKVMLDANYEENDTYVTLLEYTLFNKGERNELAHESWPRVEGHYIGALENFSKFGLSCDSHKQERFSVPDNKCEIRIKTTEDVKIGTHLIDCRDQSKKLSNYVLFQRKGDTIFFKINFPASGFFQFEIFALPASNEDKTLLNVFNYLIKVDQATNPAHAFPKQYSLWNESGCYLYEPLILNASSDLRSVIFKVHIPNATKAAVIVDGNIMHHLELRGENFEGLLHLDSHRNEDGKISLSANYGDSSKYSTLLEYRI